MTLDKGLFAERQSLLRARYLLDKEALCRVLFFAKCDARQRSSLLSARFFALGKAAVARSE
jgi:hypothetical protein